MRTQKVERVDGVPLIVHWLLKMHVPELIDATWQPHMVEPLSALQQRILALLQLP